LVFQLKDAEALGREHLQVLADFLRSAAERNVPVRLVISGDKHVAEQLQEVADDNVPLSDVTLSPVTPASQRAVAVEYLVDLTAGPTLGADTVIPFTETAAGFLFDRAAGVHALVNEIGWVAWERAFREGRATVEPAEVQAAERSVRSSFAWLGALDQSSRVDLHDPEAVAEVGRAAGLSQLQLAEVDVAFLVKRGFITRDAGNRARRGSEVRIERVVQALDSRGFGD
jgi:hypothetical protein